MINDVLVKPLDGADPWPGSDTRAAILSRPGGSAANQAAWMARFGADVVFAGRAGVRDAAYHRRELARAGARAHLAADRDAETGSIVIMVAPDGERTMFSDRGANLRLRRSDVPARLFDGAAALHLTGYTFCEPALLEVALWLVGQARARGMAFTVDPGSAAFLARMEPDAFLSYTEGAAVCFPNRDEAAILTGEADPMVMAARLTRHYGVAVVKLGAAGCVLAVPGEPSVPIAACPAQVTDTTGAGDAFCGAFLSRWLARAPAGPAPADLIAAAEFAARSAATVVTRFGARPLLLQHCRLSLVTPASSLSFVTPASAHSLVNRHSLRITPSIPPLACSLRRITRMISVNGKDPGYGEIRLHHGPPEMTQSLFLPRSRAS